MDENEFIDPEFENEMQETVKQFEDSVKKQKQLFFDEDTFENIIEYFEEHDDWLKAMTAVEQAMVQYPFSGVFMIKKAGLLLVKKKFVDALKLLDTAELLMPNELNIFLVRSDIYLGQHKYEDAIAVLEEAIPFAATEEVYDLYLEMADVYEEQDRYEKVYECLTKTLDLDDHNEEALSRMWYAVELSGNFAESIRFHQTLIDKDPYNYLAWHNVGQGYFNLGLFEKAIEAFEFVTAINEQCDLAYRDCGEAYFRLKKYNKAIELFLQAIEFSKAYEDLLFNVGVCYEHLKDFSKARHYYKKAIATEPRFVEAYYKIGNTYKKEKMWQNALNYYKKATRVNPDNAFFQAAVAEASCELNIVEELIVACDNLMESSSRFVSKRMLERMAAFLIKQECYDEALLMIQHTEETKGESGPNEFARVVCLLYLGKEKEAFENLEYALLCHPHKQKYLFKLDPFLSMNEKIIALIDTYKNQ